MIAPSLSQTFGPFAPGPSFSLPHVLSPHPVALLTAGAGDECDTIADLKSSCKQHRPHCWNSGGPAFRGRQRKLESAFAQQCLARSLPRIRALQRSAAGGGDPIRSVILCSRVRMLLSRMGRPAIAIACARSDSAVTCDRTRTVQDVGTSQWPISVRCFQCVLAGPTLGIILYADGLTPGSPLVADNRRKSTAWYLSFLQFGWRLSYEEVWLPIAFARTCACTQNRMRECCGD